MPDMAERLISPISCRGRGRHRQAEKPAPTRSESEALACADVQIERVHCRSRRCDSARQFETCTELNHYFWCDRTHNAHSMSVVDI